ncbi:MAG: PTS system mannose/fructose/sorbose family transporter subunit IID [Defluviitaleaceae bacterium]|nr:PTS system mannose/fructose/sorbose family transporter subunit IID [Defluviitaleaceae bacterium]
MSNPAINSDTSAYKLTKKDLDKLFVRSTWSLQLCWNYEAMQGLGYCWAMIPTLKKVYKDSPEDLHKAVNLHMTFFNTEPRMSAVIFGANAALEEEHGMSNPDAIIGLKTGLMGPFAGIGDTIFHTIFRAVFWAMAAQMAMAGNYWMMFLTVIASFGRLWVRWWLVHAGYREGKRVAMNLAASMKTFTEGAGILGLTVVGALIASIVNVRTAIEFYIGTDYAGNVVNQSLQDLLNNIVPAIVPLSVVLVCYWLLGKKWMTPARLMLILVVAGIVGHNIGIFA